MVDVSTDATTGRGPTSVEGWTTIHYRGKIRSMTSNGNWTQLLTLGAVVLGGLITMSTTWLANSQQSAIARGNGARIG